MPVFLAQDVALACPLAAATSVLAWECLLLLVSVLLPRLPSEMWLSLLPLVVLPCMPRVNDPKVRWWWARLARLVHPRPSFLDRLLVGWQAGSAE
mmetsp:Transcript_23789/g.66464  ORF Transcript_23789/g.66464 Transcript_23789/m.66464 type:complete len:95 (+) Transcript_23789:785-1069(+)